MGQPAAAVGFGRGAVRASDGERDRAAEQLRRCYQDGRLDSDELERRLELVHDAVTRGEIAAVLRDLPGERGTGRFALGYVRVQQRLLRWQAGAYVAVSGTSVSLWGVFDRGDFWPAWIVVPGGALLAWHAAHVRRISLDAGLPVPALRRRLEPGERRAGSA